MRLVLSAGKLSDILGVERKGIGNGALTCVPKNRGIRMNQRIAKMRIATVLWSRGLIDTSEYLRRTKGIPLGSVLLNR